MYSNEDLERFYFRYKRKRYLMERLFRRFV